MLIILLRVGIDNGKVAYPRDGSAQAHQLVSVQAIGAAEAVDDLGYRLAGNRVTLVVGQLVVFDDRAIFVFPSCGSQIHTCTINLSSKASQQKYEVLCAYGAKTQVEALGTIYLFLREKGGSLSDKEAAYDGTI